MFPKTRGVFSPNHPLKNRGFPIINRSFLGYPDFLETSNGHLNPIGSICMQCLPTFTIFFSAKCWQIISYMDSWTFKGNRYDTLPETNSSPLKIGIPNGKYIDSNHQFSGAMLVSGRVYLGFLSASKSSRHWAPRYSSKGFGSFSTWTAN